MTVSDNYSLEGFLEHSLAKFNTSDLKDGTEPMTSLGQTPIEICRYPDYRESPESSNKYDYTIMYWHILAAKLAFIVVFEVCPSRLLSLSIYLSIYLYLSVCLSIFLYIHMISVFLLL